MILSRPVPKITTAFDGQINMIQDIRYIVDRFSYDIYYSIEDLCNVFNINSELIFISADPNNRGYYIDNNNNRIELIMKDEFYQFVDHNNDNMKRVWEKFTNAAKNIQSNLYMEYLKQQVKAKEAEIEKLKNEIIDCNIKIEFFDECINESSNVNIVDFAKSLSPNIIIGQNRMFNVLTHYGFLIRKYNARYHKYVYSPTQKFINMGIFVVKNILIRSAHDTPILTSTVFVTPKGQIYLTDWFNKNISDIKADEILWNDALKMKRNMENL